jgi:hypothetical protein
VKCLRIFGPRIGTLLFAIFTLATSAVSNAAVYVSVAIAPPLLPVYEQPLIPGPGYIWTPGYWAWGPDGFYWVPGTWVLAPFVGGLWTPGYWGWSDGLYFWHPGYWGRHVGFYGGINYGFGYAGFGYQGGYWDRGFFRYNRAVNNVNVTNITNTYNTTVVNNAPARRVSYNGGSGGVIAQPTPRDRIAARETHTPLLPVQARHELAASSNRALLASVNNGHPAVAATPRPERFAAGPAPARSFSQQAAVQPGALPPRNNAVGSNPRVNNEQRLEHRNAPVNAGAPQFQAAPRSQAPVRAPSEMHPQGSPQAQMRREAPAAPQMRPQGTSQAQIRRENPPQAQLRPQGAPQAQIRREGPPQAQMRPQSPPQAQMRPQGPGHPQAQMQPQGIRPQQGQPQREARVQHGGPDDRPAERQHP